MSQCFRKLVLPINMSSNQVWKDGAMRMFGWITGEGMEEFSFRRRPEGWLFVSPGWPRRRYIVNDAQKATLATPLRRMYRAQMVATIVCVTVLVVLEQAQLDSGVFIWLCVYFGILAALTKRFTSRAITPLLAGAQPTTERAGWRNVMAQASVYPTGFLAIGVGVFSLLLLAGVIAIAADMRGPNPELVGAAIVLAGFTSYFVWLLVLKLRSRRQNDLSPGGQG